MADNGVGVVFEFVQEVLSARESDLVDVFVDFFGSHTDTVVADGESASFGVELNAHLQIVGFAFKFTCVGKCFEFLCSIYSI